MTPLLQVLLGAALLWGGGEVLVRSATRLARAWGMSPLVVGLTVVAFGTSSPELAAVLTAALKGESEVALGVVVGSNISNLALILGLTALVAPVVAHARFLRREVPFMIGVSVLLLPLAWDGTIGRAEAALLLGLLVVYFVLLLWKKEGAAVEAEFAGEYGEGRLPTWLGLVGVGAGVALLTGGAHALVEGGVALAGRFGVPERVIGITVVALGTSLPELASCVVAATRREGDIVLGNLVGSNVFNVLAMLSGAALVRPITFPAAAIRPDLAVMIGISLLVFPLLVSGLKVSRREGAVLVVLYLGYVLWLFLR